MYHPVVMEEINAYKMENEMIVVHSKEAGHVPMVGTLQSYTINVVMYIVVYQGLF